MREEETKHSLLDFISVTLIERARNKVKLLMDQAHIIYMVFPRAWYLLTGARN
jgi:hypothetical protein